MKLKQKQNISEMKHREKGLNKWHINDLWGKLKSVVQGKAL